MRSSSKSANFSLVLGLRVAGIAATRERIDARQQLGHVIGLRQVVIAAGAQPGNPVIDVAERAQDEDRHLSARGAQRLHQRKSVQLRQHAIDDRKIDGDRGGHVQALETVARDVHRMAGFPQRLRQVVARNLVVFNNQNVHGLIS